MYVLRSIHHIHSCTTTGNIHLPAIEPLKVPSYFFRYIYTRFESGFLVRGDTIVPRLCPCQKGGTDTASKSQVASYEVPTVGRQKFMYT